MRKLAPALALLLAAALLAGCASIRTAQPKSVDVEGRKLQFAGSYDERATELTLTVNGDPLMRGTFPPFTPTQRFNATYQGLAINANCYFGSVLGSKRGIVGIVGGAVQSGLGKAGDSCEISVNGKTVETLYF